MISRRGSYLARTAGLLALGGLAVHQLRYLLAFGPGSGAELHQEGHDYLAQILPILVALAVAAIVARFVVALAGPLGVMPLTAGRDRYPRDSDRYSVSGPSRSCLRRGVIYAAALVAVFWAQELTEGALAAGHPAGLAAVLGAGAWIALPLAVLLGLASAVVERLLDGAERAVAVALGDHRAPLASARAPSGFISLSRVPLAARALAFGFARRPPPPIAVT